MAVSEKLKRRKTTAADLPEEVLSREIFMRLPIKSVGRLKCVSKSWLSLFSNPQFVKQHLTYNSTQNPNDYDCLVAKKHPKIVILSRYKETSALADSRFSVVGSVRGLVCLAHDKKLFLWNPAIHQFKDLTLPQSRCHDHNYTKGFGYDPVSDNYKVVVLSRDLRSANVYDSNSHSWIDVSVPDTVHLLLMRGFLKIFTTIVKDCPYLTFTTFPSSIRSAFASSIKSSFARASLTAVKFDVGSNKFKLLPELYYDMIGLGENDAPSIFVDMNDCLTYIAYDRKSSKCILDIHSLNGEEGCWVWSKMYTITPLNFPRKNLSQGFYGGEIVYHDKGVFSCYDHKTDTIKRLGTTTSALGVFSCFKYSPSLVYLDEMKSVYLTTQTRRTTGPFSRVPRRLINSLED